MLYNNYGVVMKINVVGKINSNKGIEDFNVLIEGKYKDEIDDFKKYIEAYKGRIIVIDNNIIKSIEYNDVYCFFSDKKYNFCKTKDKTYRINHKLYELDGIREYFIRISRKCIINVNHLKIFKKNQKRKISCYFGQWYRRNDFKKESGYCCKIY